MDDDLFKKIVHDCTEFPLGAIEPFLQGEPFIDPKLFDRLELINSSLPKTKLRLYSNGGALNQRKADLLRELDVDHLYISLNTMDQERYERTIGLPFERTMENLLYLTSRHSKGRVAKHLTVRLTATEETTLGEKLRFLKLCAQLRVRPLIVGLFNYKGDIHSTFPVPGYPCEHITRLDILVSGETTLCCMDQNGDYGWGSVKKHSVLEVFNNHKAERVRRLHRSGQRSQCEPCGECNLFWGDFSKVKLKQRLKFRMQYLAYSVRYRPLF